MRHLIMNRISHWRLIVALAAILCGASVQHAFGVPRLNHQCDVLNYVACPAAGICQTPTHCGISTYHKCVTNKTFATCMAFPGVSCTPATVGCKFEEWTVMCGVGLGVFFTPICYDECGAGW